MRPDKAAAKLLEVDEDEPEAAAPESGGAEETEEVDAARDAIDAIKRGDAKALSMALARHYELCEGKDSDEEPSSGRY